MNKIPEGYLFLMEKIQKNLNEEDLKILQEISQGKIRDKKIIKNLCIKMIFGLNTLEKMKFGKMLLQMTIIKKDLNDNDLKNG